MDNMVNDILAMPNYDNINENINIYAEETFPMFIEEFIYDYMAYYEEGMNINEYVIERLADSLNDKFEVFDEYLASMGANEQDYDKYHVMFVYNMASVIINTYKKRKASSMGDIYSNDSEMLDRYGSKKTAFEKGYNNYMEGNINSFDQLLYLSAESYVKNRNQNM